MTVEYRRTALMVLVSSVLYAAQAWFFFIPFATLVSAALLFPSALHSHIFWSIIVAVHGYAVVQLWLDPDTFVLLFFYLSLIILASSMTAEPLPVLATNARLIIGVIFILAAFWKVVGVGFVSGDFFGYYLLHDQRLSPFAVLLTDLSYSDVLANREMLDGRWENQITLRSTPQVERLAALLTWFALAFELLIGLLFLIPLSKVEKVRDVALLGFLCSAYLVLPVPAFGMALATLGHAQATTSAFQTLYVIAFIAMPLSALRYYLIP